MLLNILVLVFFMLLVFAIVGMHEYFERHPCANPSPSLTLSRTLEPTPKPDPWAGMQLYMGEFRQRCYDPLSETFPGQG